MPRKKVKVEIEIHYVWECPNCFHPNDSYEVRVDGDDVAGDDVAGDDVECESCHRKFIVAEAT